MRPVDFLAIKQLVSVEKVLELIRWRPRWIEGKERRGPCPVHRSTNPDSRSFAASVEGWYCHTCKRGGDQVSLYAAVYELQPLAAAVEMCQRLGLDVPYLPRPPRKPRKPRTREEEW